MCERVCVPCSRLCRVIENRLLARLYPRFEEWLVPRLKDVAGARILDVASARQVWLKVEGCCGTLLGKAVVGAPLGDN